MKKIIFLGDSITDAEHCFSENPLGNGYVDMVDKKLNHSTGGGKKYDIVNCGHDGFTIQGVKRMLEHDCILRQPDIVSLLIGCNDVGVMMNTGKSLEEQEFEAGYESVLRELTERTRARIICMAPFIFPYQESMRTGFRESDRQKQLRKELQKDIMWNFWNYRIL